MNKDNFIWINCDCNNAAHSMRFYIDPDEEYESGTIYVDYHLNTYQPFYKRVWGAICYIFGKHSPYGAFDTIILTKEKQEELQDILDKAKDYRDNSQNKA